MTPDEIAKQILVDCEAFEAKIAAGVEESAKLMRDSFAKNQSLNDEFKNRLLGTEKPAPAATSARG